MTSATWVFMALAGLCAVVDWIAAYRGNKRLEYIAKPAVIAFLIAAVALIEPSRSDARIWFVVALLTSLAGDIFLMLPRDLFLPGLGSFLLAHIGYTIAFALQLDSAAVLLVAVAALAVLNVILLRPILKSLSSSRPQLRIPVVAYAIAISAMVSTAYATGDWRAGAGATLFMFSDFMIARHRMVRPVSWAPLAIIVTYHLGQAGLVFSLAA